MISREREMITSLMNFFGASPEPVVVRAAEMVRRCLCRRMSMSTAETVSVVIFEVARLGGKMRREGRTHQHNTYSAPPPKEMAPR